MTFNALLIEKNEAGYRASIKALDEDNLPEGDVTVRVDYSTINYKDGLAITGKSPVVRKFPLVAGIDFAGTVESSSHAAWKAGDKVVLNGWGVGETHSGGLAQRARVRGDWLVALPAGLTTRQAMAIGTAGYTAMLCVMALQGHGLKPDSGDILVTGANGGVGSVAVALLSKLGYRVIASTGRVNEAEALEGAGRGRGHRPRRVVRAGQAAGQGALGRRGRFGGQPHAGQRLRRHPVPRRGGGLRPGAGHGLPRQRGALHPARRHALRHRQRDGAQGAARAGLGASGAGPGPGASSTAWCTKSRWPAPSPPVPTSWPARCAAGWW